MRLTVLPATPERWDDVVALFGSRGDNPSWCWCRRFVGSEPQLAAGAHPDNRSALFAEVAKAAVPPGLIAYADDVPVGWTRVGPRSGFSGVNRPSVLKIAGDRPDSWWVTCFSVEGRRRGQGIGVALLRAAVEHARDNGARAVEGQPVEVAGLTAKKVGGAELFTGTFGMFRAAGFVDIGRTSPNRPIMRIVL